MILLVAGAYLALSDRWRSSVAVLTWALELRRREVVLIPPGLSETETAPLRSQQQQQDEDVRRFRSIAPTDPKIESIDAVLAFVRTARSLESRSNAVQADIGELKLDLDYFRANRQLRRRQDLSYLRDTF